MIIIYFIILSSGPDTPIGTLTYSDSTILEKLITLYPNSPITYAPVHHHYYGTTYQSPRLAVEPPAPTVE